MALARAATAAARRPCHRRRKGPTPYSPRATHATTDSLLLLATQYAWGSNVHQQAALLDRLDTLQVPSLAIIYCAVPTWQQLLHCGVADGSSGSVLVDLDKMRPSGRSFMQARIPCKDYVAAAASNPSCDCSWKSASRCRPAKDNGSRCWAVCCSKHPWSSVPATLGASDDERRLLQWEAVAAVAAYQKLLRNNNPTVTALIPMNTTVERRAASEVLLRALRPRLGSERTWLESLNGLAAQECLTSQHGYVSLLRARNISFATSASLLEPNITSGQHVSTLTAGADCAGLKCHLNVQGHKVLAAGVSRWLGSECERGIQLAAAPVNPSSYTCRLAPFADLVAEQRGFAPVDPGEGRVRGLAAFRSGDSLALWVSQQEGYIQVAFEQGWRNEGLARLSCRAPCKCAPLLLNASHPEPARRFTTITISSATWMSTDYSLGGGSICSVVIEVLSLTAGRLYLNALTVGGSITGNLGAAITQVVP